MTLAEELYVRLVAGHSTHVSPHVGLSDADLEELAKLARKAARRFAESAPPAPRIPPPADFRRLQRPDRP